MKFITGDKVVLSIKGLRELNYNYFSYFEKEPVYILSYTSLNSEFVLVICEDSQTKFHVHEDFLKKENNMNDSNLGWRILPTGEVCYFIGFNYGGVPIIQTEDGRCIPVVNSQLKDAPKECTGYGWKSVEYQSLHVGCVTLENRSGYIVDVKNPKACLCHEDKLKSLINQFDNLIKSVNDKCCLHQLVIVEDQRVNYFVDTQDIIDLCTRDKSVTTESGKKYER